MSVTDPRFTRHPDPYKNHTCRIESPRSPFKFHSTLFSSPFSLEGWPSMFTMSSGTTAELISYEHGHRFTSTWIMIPFCILFYDYVLTLKDEINFIWRKPKRLSFFLFIILRAIGEVLVIYCGYIVASLLSSCQTWNFAKKALIILQNVLVGYMFALRVWAMYNFSKRILLFLCAAAATTIALAAWSTVSEKSMTSNVASRCDYPISKESAGRVAAAWESQFLCDAIVFVFTVRRSYSQPCKISGSIVSYMARDGTLYFAVIAGANLGNILMYYFGDPWIAGSMSWFTSTLSITIMLRLMLNLHKLADAGIFTDHSTCSALAFQSRQTARDEEAFVGDR
ncbi:hypothetical protein MVEN_00602800 [Mycena venus]|uniref:DUF6533 domain-containing protein n=1 Tax=Mycena venus TaxID=2733690 RepID=A0A8H7D7R4_9AGAR|nr:hypothetical protein MVEN_00602800 [Mycena venus]